MTQQINRETENGKLIRGLPPDQAMRPCKRRHLDFASLLHMLQRARGIGPESFVFDFDDIEATISHQGDLSIDQVVFHPDFKFAVVVGIEGDVIRIKDAQAAIHEVMAREVFTKQQAEYGFERDYHAGGAKAWRRRQEKWAWLNKWFCKIEGKGAIKRWLDKFDLNRSSMDLLARNFENEATWAAKETILLENSKMAQDSDEFSQSEPNPSATPASPVIPITTAYDPQIHERTLDPANIERQENIKKEIEKRLIVVPTPHKTILFLQRRNLDPQTVALYHKIKGANKKLVDGIKDRKIDELIAEVVALAPAILPDASIATTAAAAVTTVPAEATPAPSDFVPAKVTTEDKEIEQDVRAALRNDGLKATAINKIQFESVRGLPFREQYRFALKQVIGRTK